ncbi:uncharacterized protein LOC130626189 [Hydractinia symbiolongicarpus]|uniref:uncharacterized protein LOC130626189 n=1 Tax=Hydractinia symbiolongicarpus TaxID=13093 RepID=UPI002551A167|nr:uncharacterized protein LOC130626189 [Hydractinia symbiolongicarpus]
MDIKTVMLLLATLVMTVKCLTGLGPTRRATTRSNGNTIDELCRMYPMLCRTKFKNMFSQNNQYAAQLLKKLIEAQKKAKNTTQARKQSPMSPERKPLMKTTAITPKEFVLPQQNQQFLATFRVIARVRRSLR